MKRSEFIKLGGIFTMGTLLDLNGIANNLAESEKSMPVMFIGHGSPMNGIENNQYSNKWKELGKNTPLPSTVLCISAHWLTKGTHVTAMDSPRTIHDFGGFPKELYDVKYPAPGNPKLAEETKSLVSKTTIGLDHEWGLDHGCWTIVRHMYPDANIPVLQLSIDYGKPMLYHYELAQELAKLRSKGVLIIGSGNMVHNLGMIAWDKINEPEYEYGFDWAQEANSTFKKLILENNIDSLVKYENLGKAVQNAIPSPDHYIPLLYTMGLKNTKDSVKFFNDSCVGGSLSMTSICMSSEK